MTPVLRIFKSIKTELQSAFAAPDPMRFAEKVSAPPNWFGELEAKKDVPKGGAILVNEERRVFEFGRYSNEDIPSYLTESDRQGLMRYNLNPDNPAYALCKAYFSKNPYCYEKDLAANSYDEYTEGIAASTASKVLGVFRFGMVDKPTF